MTEAATARICSDAASIGARRQYGQPSRPVDPSVADPQNQYGRHHDCKHQKATISKEQISLLATDRQH